MTSTIDYFGELSKVTKVQGSRHTTWLRIQATWRNSKDFNVAIDSRNGVAVDHGDGAASYSFKGLMEKLGCDYKDTYQNFIKPPKVDPQEALKAYQARVLEAEKTWNRGKPLSTANYTPATVAKHYLANRGLPEGLLVDQIRADYGSNGTIKIMVPMYTADGKFQAMQRIFVDKEGNKIPDNAKAMLGPHMTLTGQATGLLISANADYKAKGTVIVCEGPETGMALHAATGAAVLVAFDAAGLEKLDTQYFKKYGFTDVVVAGDSDRPNLQRQGIRRGEEAATKLANRLMAESLTVSVALPQDMVAAFQSKETCDWLDVYVNNPSDVGMVVFAPDYKTPSAEPPNASPKP